MAVANSRKGGKSQNVKTRQSRSKKSDEVGRGDIIRPKREILDAREIAKLDYNSDISYAEEKRNEERT